MTTQPDVPPAIDRRAFLGIAGAARRGEGTHVLSQLECLRLLGSVDMGRLALSVGALPAVVPVRFVLVDEAVFFAAPCGSDLEAAVRDQVVAFEVDEVDPTGGWSVVVTGIPVEVTVDEEPALPELMALATSSGAPQSVFRLPACLVTGRGIPSAPIHVAGLTVAGTPRTRLGHSEGRPFEFGHPEPIEPAECRRLLASEEVGRLAVVVGGRPLVFPLNYALDGEAVVFRTAPGTKLHAITRSLVTFEADGWSTASRTAWSVVVDGFAQEVTSADAPGLRERLARLPVHPLAGGERRHYVRITPFSITGSRFRLPGPETASG
jgi:nitroimidazol reductase NimA-like FMN-containing flavoprotein (pyridoxamine 5'-phosphate oxidase superfamily)